MTKNKRKRWKRSGNFIKHHIKNRSRGGSSHPSNLLRFDKEREDAWHFLFKNLSFLEVAELLMRADKAKRSQR